MPTAALRHHAPHHVEPAPLGWNWLLFLALAGCGGFWGGCVLIVKHILGG